MVSKVIVWGIILLFGIGAKAWAGDTFAVTVLQDGKSPTSGNCLVRKNDSGNHLRSQVGFDGKTYYLLATQQSLGTLASLGNLAALGASVLFPMEGEEGEVQGRLEEVAIRVRYLERYQVQLISAHAKISYRNTSTWVPLEQVSQTVSPEMFVDAIYFGGEAVAVIILEGAPPFLEANPSGDADSWALVVPTHELSEVLLGEAQTVRVSKVPWSILRILRSALAEQKIKRFISLGLDVFEERCLRVYQVAEVRLPETYSHLKPIIQQIQDTVAALPEANALKSRLGKSSAQRPSELRPSTSNTKLEAFQWLVGLTDSRREIRRQAKKKILSYDKDHLGAAFFCSLVSLIGRRGQLGPIIRAHVVDILKHFSPEGIEVQLALVGLFRFTSRDIYLALSEAFMALPVLNERVLLQLLDWMTIPGRNGVGRRQAIGKIIGRRHLTSEAVLLKLLHNLRSRFPGIRFQTRSILSHLNPKDLPLGNSEWVSETQQFLARFLLDERSVLEGQKDRYLVAIFLARLNPPHSIQESLIAGLCSRNKEVRDAIITFFQCLGTVSPSVARTLEKSLPEVRGRKDALLHILQNAKRRQGYLPHPSHEPCLEHII